MTRKTRIKIGEIRKTVLPVIYEILIIVVGSILMAISYNIFVIPHGLLSGGISGIALFGKYLLGIPFYIGVMILNIPVLIFGFKELDRKFMIYSLIGTVIMVISIPLIKPYVPIPQTDMVLASIFSGVIGGVGDGIILRSGASTGGLDIVGMIANKKWNIPIGNGSFYFNVGVILLSLIFFKVEIALYTVISMWVGAQVVDKIIDGLANDKSVVIISEENKEIASRIMNEMNRGVTLLEGQGGYTGDSKQVVNCVINHVEVPKLKNIVQQIDPKAFIVITEAVEVAGKGFN